MKTFLLLAALLCTAIPCKAPFFANSARWQGDYWGVAIPVGTCSNERLLIHMVVNGDGTLEGGFYDWEINPVHDFYIAWPFFTVNRFTDGVAIGNKVSGTLDASGGVAYGVFNSRDTGGCAYTWRAFRRYKTAQ